MKFVTRPCSVKQVDFTNESYSYMEAYTIRPSILWYEKFASWLYCWIVFSAPRIAIDSYKVLEKEDMNYKLNNTTSIIQRHLMGILHMQESRKYGSNETFKYFYTIALR